MGFFSNNIGIAAYNNCSACRNLWCYKICEVSFVNINGFRFIKFEKYAESHSFLVIAQGPQNHVYGSFPFYSIAALGLAYHCYPIVAFCTGTQNGFSRNTYFLLGIWSKM